MVYSKVFYVRVHRTTHTRTLYVVLQTDDDNNNNNNPCETSAACVCGRAHARGFVGFDITMRMHEFRTMRMARPAVRKRAHTENATRLEQSATKTVITRYYRETTAAAAGGCVGAQSIAASRRFCRRNVRGKSSPSFSPGRRYAMLHASPTGGCRLPRYRWKTGRKTRGLSMCAAGANIDVSIAAAELVSVQSVGR